MSDRHYVIWLVHRENVDREAIGRRLGEGTWAKLGGSAISSKGF